MVVLVLTITYLLLGLLLLHPYEAVSQAVVFGLATYGGAKASRATSWKQFTAWFRRYPAKGFLCVALPLAVIVMGVSRLGLDFGRALLGVPLGFAWFWLFSTIGTRYEEHRLDKAVEAELARRAQRDHPGGGDAP